MIQKEKFSVFFDNITEIKIGLDYYTDFKKVINNVNTISLRLTQLNYLVGQKDMRKAVEEVWEENPKAFSVMGILVAVRKKQNKKAWGRDGSERLVYNYLIVFTISWSLLKTLDCLQFYKTNTLKILLTMFLV